MEIQTGANDVAVEARGGGRLRRCEQGALEVEVVQRFGAIVHGAKIVIQVFSLNAPASPEHPLKTTADGPSDAGVFVTAAGRVRVRNARSIRDHLRNARSGPNLAISQTAGRISEQTRRYGKAETATRGTKIRDLPSDSGCLDQEFRRATSDFRAAIRCSGVIAPKHA